MSKRVNFIKEMEIRHKNTVLETLGITVEAYEPEVVVSLLVDNRHLQHAGIVHGGIYVLLAETAASIAGALSINMLESDIFGMEINANHLKPAYAGEKISATAKIIHKGRTTMVVTVEIASSKGHLVSVGRCTLAVRNK
ncbi:MAG: PaaI family thioesterase [bacterium]|nr:PaaI family thioesterase [bacterium]